jgi:hypothetical protein
MNPFLFLRPFFLRRCSAVAAFARAPNGGLIVTASPAALLHRERIISLAAPTCADSCFR